MGMLTPDSEYKLVSKVLNPFLYELFVKGNGKDFKTTNLILKLNSYEPKNYEHIEISMKDYGKIGDFSGLIIEPATTDTLIKIDASSTVNAHKIRGSIIEEGNPIYTKEGSDPKTTIVAKNLFEINNAQNINLYYNQDERVFIDKFNISDSKNISFYNIEKVEKQESFSIVLSNLLTFYAKKNIKDFISVDFNKEPKVKGIFYISGNDDKAFTNSVSFRSNTINLLSNEGSEATFRLTADNILECVNTRFIRNKNNPEVGEIKGRIDNFVTVGTTLFLDGTLDVKTKDMKIFFKNNSVSGEPAFVIEGDNSIVCKNFKCENHVVTLVNVNMNSKDGNIFFKDNSEVFTKYEGKENSYLDSFVYENSSNNGVCFSCFDSSYGSIIVSSKATTMPTPIISGIINRAILHNCTIGDSEKALVPTYFYIYHANGEGNIQKNLSGVIFEPKSETKIITYGDQAGSLVFKNCLFKGNKNELEIRDIDIKVDNSEFNNVVVRANGKPDSQKKAECVLNTSVLTDKVELLAMNKIEINSSTLKDTVLSQTTLVEGSVMENFKGNKSEYKNFFSNSKDEPNIEVGATSSEDFEIL